MAAGSVVDRTSLEASSVIVVATPDECEGGDNGHQADAPAKAVAGRTDDADSAMMADHTGNYAGGEPVGIADPDAGR